MITVNAFWFGVLMTLFAMFVAMFIIAYFHSKRGEKSHEKFEEYDPSEDEFREALEEMTGKKFRIVKKNGFMIGEIIDGGVDESEDH